MEDREIGFDSEIQNDGEAFTLIPEGEYEFTVIGFERKRQEAKNDIPAHNVAVLKLEIKNADGKVGVLTERLQLRLKMEWKLSEFFRSIGQKKHGEKLSMNWGAVPGSSGLCKITTDKFKGRDGSDRESNRVKFLDPKTAQSDASRGW